MKKINLLPLLVMALVSSINLNHNEFFNNHYDEGLIGINCDEANEKANIDKISIKELESNVDGVVGSSMFVQHGNDGTYDYLRYAVALKGNIDNIVFTRSVPTYSSSATDEVSEEITTVYKGIAANDEVYYYNAAEAETNTKGLTTNEEYKGDYYWACYSIRFTSSTYKEAPVSVELSVNDGEFMVSRSMKMTNLKYGVTHEFFAIDDYTNVERPVTPIKNKTENCVGATSSGLVSIEFPLHINSDTTSIIYAAISAGGKTSLNFSDHYKFYINDELQNVNAVTPVGTLFKDYDSVNLGTYNLSKGLNTFKFTIDKSLADVTAFNFRSIKFNTTAEISWAETECESKCELCGGCKDANCEHDVCLTKCDCQSIEYKAIDTNTIVGGVGSKNTKEDCVGSSSQGLVSIEFPIALERKGNIAVSVVMSASSSAKKFTDHYNFYINDTLQTSDALTPVGVQWGDYTIVDLGVYNFEQTTNVIKFTIDKSLAGVTAFNFRSLILTGCFSSWTETECESQCLVCGKCLDETCTQDVCSAKCNCMSKTYSILEDSVEVSGNTKNETNECVGVSSKAVVNVVYNIYSQSACKVQLTITMSRWTSERNIIRSSENDTANHAYSLYINDEEQFSSAKTIVTSNSSDSNLKFTEFDEIVLGIYELKEGNNTILLSADFVNTGKINVNFRAFTLTSGEESITLI